MALALQQPITCDPLPKSNSSTTPKQTSIAPTPNARLGGFNRKNRHMLKIRKDRPMNLQERILNFIASVCVCLFCTTNAYAQGIPIITAQTADESVLDGAEVTLIVAVSGPGPLMFQWQFNGTNLPNNLVTTVAGGGSVNPDDGGAATNALLGTTRGVAFDSLGNLYFGDSGSNRVCKIDTNGNVTTVAGGGSGGLGDGGPATNATLDFPVAVVVDIAGNLYIADDYNNRIRKVDANGIITTIAGGGSVSPPRTGQGTAGTNVVLNQPNGAALDAAGNFYFGDYNDGGIYRVNTTNGQLTTVKMGVNYPAGVTVDSSGNLYIACASPFQGGIIYKLSTNGSLTTIAGDTAGGFSGDGGPATKAGLEQPDATIFDGEGNLYIADQLNSCIRIVDTNGIINTVAGVGQEFGYLSNSVLGAPFGLAFDRVGNLYTCDQKGFVREVNFAGLPYFSLTNVNAANVGDYDVIISNPQGSVTSKVFSVSIIAGNTPPEVNFPISHSLFTNFGFSIEAAVGQTIAVDSSTDLVEWTALATNYITNSLLYFSDPAPATFSRRFYRARLISP
jgi:sugar lactone lactonase YvrE